MPAETETANIQNAIIVKKRKVGLTRSVSSKMERTCSIDAHTTEQSQYETTNSASAAVPKPIIGVDSQ
jgi:hypothetical protein